MIPILAMVVNTVMDMVKLQKSGGNFKGKQLDDFIFMSKVLHYLNCMPYTNLSEFNFRWQI